MCIRRLAGPLVLASAAWALWSLSAAPPTEGRRFALVVAVQDYGGTDLGNLRYADNDGNDLADLLRKQGYRRVVLMTRSEALKQDKDDLDPRADTVREHLKGLLEDCREGDTVLVAFAGHGVQLNRDGKFYFCPRKANLDDPKTLVSLDEVYAEMKDCRASAKLLVADACRNDPLAGEAAGDGRLKSVTRPALEKPDGGVLALFSCSEGQRAYESDALKHGVFFYYFLEGLRGKAADPKTGEVELLDLVKYVRDEVPVTVKAEQGEKYKQKPNFLGDLNDKVVLARVDASSPPPDASTTETGEREETFEYMSEGRTKTGKRRVLTVDLGGGVKMELVRIGAGTFQMGSSPTEKERLADESTHRVEITKAFYMGKYPVTVLQFRAFVKAADYKTEAEADGDGGFGYTGKGSFPFEQDKRFSWRDPGFEQADSHPVVNVSWNDAQAFCKWLRRKEQKTYRLPTEAEWEYCCRAGTTTRFFSGDDVGNLASVANIADRSFRRISKDFPTEAWDDGYAFTAPVDEPRFRGNAFGLYGMHGNVWQWCSDWNAEDYYKNSPKRDPSGPGIGDKRVMRGGSWCTDGATCRAARRDKSEPESRLPDLGFRVICAIEPGSR